MPFFSSIGSQSGVSTTRVLLRWPQATMVLTMTATPIAMKDRGYSFDQTATTIQTHAVPFTVCYCLSLAFHCRSLPIIDLSLPFTTFFPYICPVVPVRLVRSCVTAGRCQPTSAVGINAFLH